MVKRISKESNEPGRFYRGMADCYREKDIPLFEVADVFSFTKLIGHAKYINSSFGRVLYRGQYRIDFSKKEEESAENENKTLSETNHQRLSPSAYRYGKNKHEVDANIDKQIQRLLDDKGKNSNGKDIASFVKCDKGTESAKLIFEALLQHYGAETRFLDVVDNHWIALWFASHQYDKSIGRYVRNENKYSYVIVFALPTTSESSKEENGLFYSDECIAVDLRQACPSTILRPHMQHGMLFALKDENGDYLEDYAKNVVCVIKIRTDYCIDWLGQTDLLREESLFPCRSKDEMLNMIKKTRSDLFDDILKKLNTDDITNSP